MAAYRGVSVTPGSPVRPGIFATADSGRVAAGASYWGIMDLSGNLREQVISAGHVNGRGFRGTHGAGMVELPADWPEAKYRAGAAHNVRLSDGAGSSVRGGSFTDLHDILLVSDRHYASIAARGSGFAGSERSDAAGWRAVRTAPETEQARFRAGPGAQRETLSAGPAEIRPFVAVMPWMDKSFRVDGILDEWTAKPPVLVRRAIQNIYPLSSRDPVGDRVYWEGPADLGVRIWWGWDPGGG